jgi:glycosyltransferase A (GT-A) superfamily protein (DUF2064 family)
MSDRIALGVMARAPSDDRGKTRLIRALDIEDGAGLRRAILLDTLESIGAVHFADRIILFTPDDAREEVAGLDSDAARLLPQRGETLSQRLISGFADLFALGYDAAAIVGSDLPTLPAAHVEEGIAALARLPDPIVLGQHGGEAVPHPGGIAADPLAQFRPDHGVRGNGDSAPPARVGEPGVELLPGAGDLRSG